MTMLELVKHLNFAVVVLFTLLYLYQGFYVVVGPVSYTHLTLPTIVHV